MVRDLISEEYLNNKCADNGENQNRGKSRSYVIQDAIFDETDY